MVSILYKFVSENTRVSKKTKHIGNVKIVHSAKMVAVNGVSVAIHEQTKTKQILEVLLFRSDHTPN